MGFFELIFYVISALILFVILGCLLTSLIGLCVKYISRLTKFIKYISNYKKYKKFTEFLILYNRWIGYYNSEKSEKLKWKEEGDQITKTICEEAKKDGSMATSFCQFGPYGCHCAPCSFYGSCWQGYERFLVLKSKYCDNFVTQLKKTPYVCFKFEEIE